MADAPDAQTARELEEAKHRLFEKLEPTPLIKHELITSTGAPVRRTPESEAQDTDLHYREDAHFFKRAEWTPDGTSIITNGCDCSLRTFVLTSEQLASKGEVQMIPYSSFRQAENLREFAIHPQFNIADTGSTLVLTSVPEHPIRLTNILDPNGKTYYSYTFMSAGTEEFIAPMALEFIADGRQFVCGGKKDTFAIFEVENPRIMNVSRSKDHKGKGFFTTFALSSMGTLAAGTTNRHVTLLDNQGRGGVTTSFKVGDADHGFDECCRLGRCYKGGSGVSSMKWSACGRYLYIAERGAPDGVLMYDIRGLGRRLGWLAGRNADTMQRDRIDVAGNEAGHLVYAGGKDGQVAVWKNPHLQENRIDPSATWHAHDDPVTSVSAHPFASVLATSAAPDYRTMFPTYDSSSSSSSSSSSESDDDDDEDMEKEDDNEEKQASQAASSDTVMAEDADGPASPAASSSSSSAASYRPAHRDMLKLWSLEHC